MTAKPPLDILLCAPRGFCAGVVRAIDAVEKALALHGAPVFVRHEIVHNKYVVESLKRKGAVFVAELSEVPDATRPVIFSAHGVPKSVPAQAQARNLFHIDATCPLVTKVHREAEVHHKRGRHILLVGLDDLGCPPRTPGSTTPRRPCTRRPDLSVRSWAGSPTRSAPPSWAWWSARWSWP